MESLHTKHLTNLASLNLEYRKLGLNEIRIVEILSKESRQNLGRNSVACYTHIATLGTIVGPALPYVALSYTWGNLVNKFPIYLDDKVVMVTENLSIALQHLEQTVSTLSIWIDALCINQADDVEKSQQVRMMPQIYSQSSEVLVWLGPSYCDSDVALKTLRDVGTETMLDCVIKGQTDEQARYFDWSKLESETYLDNLCTKWSRAEIATWNFAAIGQIFLRPWFRRVWVLQEAAANNVTFLCGNERVSKISLYLGSIVIVALANGLGASHETPEGTYPFWETLSGANFISRRTMRLVTSQRTHLRLQDLLLETSANLGDWTYEATDPRDRVFALLGFSSDSSLLDISCDYDKSCRHIYIEVAERILTQSSGLDLLYAISGPKNVMCLPSWAPDWTVSNSASFGLRQLHRFCASGYSSSSQPSFSSDRFGNRILTLRGCVFDTIHTKMTMQWDPQWEHEFYRHPDAIQFIQTLRSFGTNHPTAYNSEEARMEALWRTPLADCDAFFGLSQTARPSASARMKASFDAFVEVNALDEKARATASKPYLHVMGLQSRQRQIFISSQGYFGLGQDSMATGDLVCLLFGGDSPFILRPSKVGYQLIGEAYVHGIMHGEYLAANNPPTEEFILY
ncbi:heterokaryon incompatibility protein-domain-containing protein [Xylaria flabelliformis]|nr:heterokaryon incompatibility protein-domain-containing protein [Xylaria flabelliformis]